MSYKLVSLIVLAICMQQGLALKCYDYSCYSANPACNEELKECPLSSDNPLGGFFVKNVVGLTCVKAVYKESGSIVTAKSGYCAVGSGACVDKRKEHGNNLAFCETCDTDGCNGSSVLAPAASLFLLVAALVTLMARQ